MKMSDGGKGSAPRPYSVSQEEYASRWDAIFKRDGLEDNKKDVVEERDVDPENPDELS